MTVYRSGHKLLGILPNFIAGRPHVAEFDLSGVIVASKDERFQVGDPVYGWVPSSQCKYTFVCLDSHIFAMQPFHARRTKAL